MPNADIVGEAATGTQSLERAVALLREVASHGNRGARLTDLVADSGFSKATVRRLLVSLVRESLLEQDESTRRYYLGVDTFVCRVCGLQIHRGQNGGADYRLGRCNHRLARGVSATQSVSATMDYIPVHCGRLEAREILVPGIGWTIRSRGISQEAAG